MMLFNVDHIFPLTFHMWQKMKSQTMANAILVSLLSPLLSSLPSDEEEEEDCWCCCCGVWTPGVAGAEGVLEGVCIRGGRGEINTSHFYCFFTWLNWYLSLASPEMIYYFLWENASSVLTCLALPGRRLTMAALPRCLRAAAAEARLLYWEFDKGEKEMKENLLASLRTMPRWKFIHRYLLLSATFNKVLL